MKNANLVSWRRSWFSIGLMAVLLTGCGQGETKPKALPKSGAEYFTIKVGAHPVRMQLAVLRPEMERGLMERRDLGADDGMLFIYLRPQRMSFWMRNTPLPLDIGFFDANGTLLEIYPLHPHDENPVASHGDQMQFALEMNQGWFKANGIRPGERLDMAALVAALKERDFAPKQFGFKE